MVPPSFGDVKTAGQHGRTRLGPASRRCLAAASRPEMRKGARSAPFDHCPPTRKTEMREGLARGGAGVEPLAQMRERFPHDRERDDGPLQPGVHARLLRARPPRHQDHDRGRARKGRGRWIPCLKPAYRSRRRGTERRLSNEKPRSPGLFFRADEGTRTLDLLHGKQTL